MNCPFCDEPDFDLVGLKSHLSQGECDIYEMTETAHEEFMRKRRERREETDHQ